MVKIEILMDEGKVTKISEIEIDRYASFFANSYKDNLAHSSATLDSFPRWSIISGYYAMHDITKLLLAKKFRLKIELEVHATTIKVLQDVIKNPELLALMARGYGEFISLANDLAEAKKERVKIQYYTGTPFSKELYAKRAEDFLKDVVMPYLEKIKLLLEEE